MGSTSSIEWTDSTWSPIRARLRPDALAIAKRKGYDSLVQILTAKKKDGSPRVIPGQSVGPHCERVSPGCEGCYSEANNHRCLPHNGTGLPFDRRSRDLVEIFVDQKILTEPLRWRKPRIIFVESQADLYGEWVTDEMIDQVKAVEALAPQHFFLELTKRAERMRAYSSRLLLDPSYLWLAADLLDIPLRLVPETVQPEPYPLRNVWLGVSVEDQQRADERIPYLLRTPAALRYVSYEPALGPVDCTSLPSASGIGRYLDALSNAGVDPGALISNKLDWLIAGGQSGVNANPSHPDWFRSVRDQCAEAGVPFLFKQWGAHCECDQLPDHTAREVDAAGEGHYSDSRIFGKKAAGRLLDGREHNEFPQAILDHLQREASCTAQ